MSAPVGRFAPTPSGFLHPGNLLCAMLAYLSARSAGGSCLLRIEDLDRTRCPPHLVQQCLQDLAWLGFRWDGPLIMQSQRTGAYQQAFDRIQALGRTYPCFCTRAQLHADLAPNRGDTIFVYPGTCRSLTAEEAARRQLTRAPARRLRVMDETISFCDHLQGTYTARLTENPGDFILQRSDGVFAYHLACTVDDFESGITEIVRGSDILSATPCQICLQQILGFPLPEYYHIPLLVDADGTRLSKRKAAISLQALARHYTAEEIIGTLAYTAGILPEQQPASLESLIPLFRWNLVPRDDLVLPRGFLTPELSP